LSRKKEAPVLNRPGLLRQRSSSFHSYEEKMMVTQAHYKPSGVVLYRGKSMLGGDDDIVVVATLHSDNRKTGNMIQVWILMADMDPYEAIRRNRNQGVCGKCFFQGTWNPETEKYEARVCYVNLGHAPLQIYRSYQQGRYPEYWPGDHDSLFLCRKIRWGAYGDPAAVPIPVIRRFLRLCAFDRTGYSNQLFWIDRRRAETLAQWFMCSCHTPAQLAEAERRGWRAFLTVPDEVLDKRPRQRTPAWQKAIDCCIECPYTSHGVACVDCRLCNGYESSAKSVFIGAHGAVGRNLKQETV
jgi:hypothetical protein